MELQNSTYQPFFSPIFLVLKNGHIVQQWRWYSHTARVEQVQVLNDLVHFYQHALPKRKNKLLKAATYITYKSSITPFHLARHFSSVYSHSQNVLAAHQLPSSRAVGYIACQQGLPLKLNRQCSNFIQYLQRIITHATFYQPSCRAKSCNFSLQTYSIYKASYLGLSINFLKLRKQCNVSNTSYTMATLSLENSYLHVYCQQYSGAGNKKIS